MEKSVTMPKLGMTMEEGTILNWLYQEGDMVEKGEPLVEVMTDKVNLEVEAPFSGRLARILAHDGDVMPVGEPIAVLVDETSETASKDAGARQAPQPSAPSAPSDLSPAPTAATRDITAPTTTTPVAPERWTADGGRIASTPAAKREAALHAIDLHTLVQAGMAQPLTRSDVLAFLEERSEQKVRATPVAQKMAQEHQVDLAALAALKPGAKLTRADVEAHLANGQQVQQQAAPERAAQTAQPQTTPVPGDELAAPALNEQDYELIPLSPVRRIIGQRMLNSITTAPHIYLDTEIDMSEAERWRQHVGRSLKAENEPAPSMTAILLRACAAALILHPEVNAAFVPGDGKTRDAIKRWHVVHTGVAVDTEQALLTPVIRNAHQLSLPQIARELRRMTQAARENTLKPEDLAGATFTISNLGMYGIDTFHAIIAPGQGAILAVGKITKRGVVIENTQGEHIEIRPVMKVSLSADHRVLDGASGSRFLQRLKSFLEDPYLLL